MTGLDDEARPIFDEVAAVLAGVPPERLDALVEGIAAARTCALYGQGRTGLVMQAFAMRLHHLGVAAHVVGAMNAPPLGPGDLFLVNAAKGDLPTGLALIASARRAGARIALFTAAVDSEAARDADHVIPIPAGMGGAAAPSNLAMGGTYEFALLTVTELIVLRLMKRLGVTEAAMWSRHANLL